METVQLVRAMSKAIDRGIILSLMEASESEGKVVTDPIEAAGKAVVQRFVVPVESLARVLVQRVKPIALLMTQDDISGYADFRGKLIQEMDIAAFDVIREFEITATDTKQRDFAIRLRKSLQDVGV